MAFDVIGTDSGSQPEDVFDAAIQLAAQTISAVLADRRFIVSHAGEGVFVGFYSGRRVIWEADLQSAINQELTQSRPSDPIAIEVTIPTSLRLISGRGALDVLMGYVDSRLQPLGENAPVDQETVERSQEQEPTEFQS